MACQVPPPPPQVVRQETYLCSWGGGGVLIWVMSIFEKAKVIGKIPLQIYIGIIGGGGFMVHNVHLRQINKK